VFSVPAVAGDSVFIGSCAGTFYSLHKDTGQLQWSYDIRKDGKQRSFHGNPLIVGDLILIGTDQGCDSDSIGHVYAFDRRTGAVKWKYKSTSVPTDIIQVGSNIYFGSYTDRWSAAKLETGDLIWNFPIGTSNPDCDPIKSPVTDGSHVYITGLDGVIYSLDAASGRLVWKRKLTAAPSTSTALKGKSLFVGTTDNRIYRLNSQTGESEAEITVEAQPVGRPTFTVDSLFFFLENRAERSGYIVSLTPDLAKVRWTQRSSPEWASERAHVARGLVIAGNCRGELAAFQVSDGAPKWKVSLKGCIRSVGDSGDTLFAGVQEGTVYALSY
jgi:outer membrane protein assembly factor BamB